MAEPAELPPRHVLHNPLHVEVGRVEPEHLRVRSSVEMWCFRVCFRVTYIDEAKTVFTYGPGRGHFRSDGTPRDNTPLRHMGRRDGHPNYHNSWYQLFYACTRFIMCVRSGLLFFFVSWGCGCLSFSHYDLPAQRTPQDTTRTPLAPDRPDAQDARSLL